MVFIQSMSPPQYFPEITTEFHKKDSEFAKIMKDLQSHYRIGRNLNRIGRSQHRTGKNL